MKLIGMLDSPYVRRVAISLDLYGVDFVHEPLSVFRSFDAFAQINPVVKAPTLVLDDGTVLMDSSLILDYLETLAPANKKLLAQNPPHAPGTCTSLAWPWQLAKKACRLSTSTTCARLKSSMRRGLTGSAGSCSLLIRCWKNNCLTVRC